MANKENKYLIYDEPVKKDWKFFLRYSFLFCIEPFYKLLFLKKKSFAPKKYHISICGCFKNEARFVKEWIEYHLMMGVDHFYLYNNNSDDNYLEILQPYIDKGIVTLEHYPNIPAQPGIYQHWYENYRQESDWVSFLDFDEFFVPLKHDNLKDWLDENGKYPVLLIYWKMFGTSGLMNHDDSKLCIEQYTVSWPKLDAVGKLLVNTNYDIVELITGSMHFLKVKYHGFQIPPINIFKHFVLGGIHRINSKEPDIQLNHYWSKAFDIYELKHRRGSGSFAKSWKTFDKFCWHENHNTSTDYAIYRFLVQFKLRMQNDGNNIGKE